MEESQWLQHLLRQAGFHVRTAFASVRERGYSFKGQQDYLTQTDMEVEQLVHEAVSGAFPGDAFLGEETGGDVQAVDRVWVLDPIDGTANFARGVPHFCISLALLEQGIPVLAAIYDPMREELFVAAKGRGAFLNGELMQVSAVALLTQASVEVGWSNRRPPEQFLGLAEKMLRAGAAFRRAGSGALGLAYVAAGRSDAYVELHINAWDVAAGLLLVSEAGGVSNQFWTPQVLREGNTVLACNAALSMEMSNLTGIAL